jgi:hypothetical protein
MNDKEALEMLLKTYVEMVRLKSCEVGEKSHMLAYHTDFVKGQIKQILKRLGHREDLSELVKETIRENRK